MDEQIWARRQDTLVFNPLSYGNSLSFTVRQRRFTDGIGLFRLLGALALLLAAVEDLRCDVLHGAQRTSEIGIRVALGAAKTHVLELVSRDGMVWAGFGLLAACLFRWALTRVLSSNFSP